MVSVHRLAGVAVAGFLIAGSASLEQATAQVTSPPAQTDSAPPIAPALTKPSPAMLVAQRVATIASRADHSDDIAALKAYYEAAPSRLLWIDGGVLNARALAAIAEIGKAGDWGLTSSSFTLPRLMLTRTE